MTDIAQQAAQAALAGQQQGQPQQPVMMMMPPTSVAVGETPDKQNVVIQLNTIYGSIAIALTPNDALAHCRILRTKAKELNQNVVKRQGPGGAVLLDKAPVLLEGDEDDEDDDTGDVAEPSEGNQPNDAA
jgi:hypothetical protein